MAYNGAEGVRFDFDGALALARNLWTMADELEGQAAAMGEAGMTALSGWLGPYGTEFLGRRDVEHDSFGIVVQGLRAEAITWGQGWAGAVNEANRRRRAAAVAAEQANRSMMEKVADAMVHGDDSDRQIAPVVEVSPPQPPSFAATGGLQNF